jgi:hypothetical protein
LEIDAVGCVVCGTPVGISEITSDVKVLTAKQAGNQSTVINTLNFLEINKGITRSLDASFTNEFGVSIGGAALAAIINGRSPIEKSKNGRVQVQDVYPTEVQQLSLFGSDSQQTIDAEVDKQATISKNTDKNSGSSKKLQNSSRSKRVRRSAMPEILDIDLDSGEIPFKNFCQQKNPAQESKRYLVIATWFYNYCNQKEISTNHIFTCYRSMGWNTPNDINKPFSNMKPKGWFKNVNKNLWSITHIGLNVVNDMKGE